MNKTVKTFEGELELGHLDMLVAASARDMWVEELQCSLRRTADMQAKKMSFV